MSRRARALFVLALLKDVWSSLLFELSRSYRFVCEFFMVFVNISISLYGLSSVVTLHLSYLFRGLVWRFYDIRFEWELFLSRSWFARAVDIFAIFFKLVLGLPGYVAFSLFSLIFTICFTFFFEFYLFFTRPFVRLFLFDRFLDLTIFVLSMLLFYYCVYQPVYWVISLDYNMIPIWIGRLKGMGPFFYVYVEILKELPAFLYNTFMAFIFIWE